METTGEKFGGRPTKHKKEYNEQSYKLCLLGATDKDLADFFEVEESTINNWKSEFPEFLESIKRGKLIADANVADRLYQKALGYEHDDIELKVVSNGNNSGSEVQKVPVRKYYPPDTTAAIFWLKNRRSKDWRDKQSIIFEKMSDEDLQKLVNELIKNAENGI